MNEELISHWQDIIGTVFRAEHEILKQGWREKLEEYKSKGESDNGAHEYIRAIAIEILSKSQLNEVYKEVAEKEGLC